MRYVELTNSYIRAICDDSAYEMLSKYSWNVVFNRDGTPRAIQAWVGDRTIGMHQLVLATTSDLIDHRNHNVFDNRLDNLRSASYAQNMQNSQKRKRATSKYKGVSWNARSSKWKVAIRVNRELIYLGLFGDEIEAAKVYNKAAIKHFGEFAKLNEFGDPLGSEGEKKDVR